MPPNLRRNTAPVAQRPQRVLPNTQSITDFPSLGGTTIAATTPTAGNNWATKAKEWAAHDELTAEQEQERKRAEQRQEQHTRIDIPIFVSHRSYTPIYPNEDDEIGIIDEAEAYVGGYNHAKYAAYEYEEPTHTPPYSPTPW
jgi:hypothetical protein